MILQDSSLSISCRVTKLLELKSGRGGHVHKDESEPLCECFLYRIVNNLNICNHSIEQVIGSVSTFENEKTVVRRETVKAMGWTFGRIFLLMNSPHHDFRAIGNLESYIILLKKAGEEKENQNRHFSKQQVS